jgi:hypothetical protein
MTVVSRFAKKLKELEVSIDKSIQTSIAKNEKVLTEQQTDGQFDKGKDAFNVSIVPKYATSTKNIKRGKGQPINRVTLKDTGELYNKVNIKANATEAIITANVSYFKYLVTHYEGNQLLGIQDEAMRKFLVKYTLPEIKKNFKAIIKK